MKKKYRIMPEIFNAIYDESISAITVFNSSFDNQIRLMALNGSDCELIEGYNGGIDFVWDSNGNLSEIKLKVVLKDDSFAFY